LVEIVLAQPRLAAIISLELVKFFEARIAATKPLLAARPGLKLLFICQRDTKSAAACDRDQHG